MSFTAVKPNAYNFSEITNNDKQPEVTNGLGRTALYAEFVYLDGYFGEVRDYGGIEDSESGRINIDGERIIKTQQIEATDTFTAGNVLHFVPGGSSAAGKFVDAPETGSIPVGVITGEEGTGGAQTAVEFRPFIQGAKSIVDGVQIREIDVPAASHAAGTPVVDLGIPVGSIITGVKVIGKAVSSGGTITVSDGTNAITDAIACAAVDAVDVEASIDLTYRVVAAAGITLTAGQTGDAGLVQVSYV